MRFWIFLFSFLRNKNTESCTEFRCFTTALVMSSQMFTVILQSSVVFVVVDLFWCFLLSGFLKISILKGSRWLVLLLVFCTNHWVLRRFISVMIFFQNFPLAFNICGWTTWIKGLWTFRISRTVFCSIRSVWESSLSVFQRIMIECICFRHCQLDAFVEWLMRDNVMGESFELTQVDEVCFLEFWRTFKNINGNKTELQWVTIYEIYLWMK